LKPKGYPENPKTLAEHLRRRRMDLGMTQKEAAHRLGAGQWTVINWENGRTAPAIRFLPGINAFLGFDPFDLGTTFRQRIRNARWRLGLSQRHLASQLVLGGSSVHDVESGRVSPQSKTARRVAQSLSTDEPGG
jgi:DNA-binding XRE family transcriptional regulator